MILNDNLDYEQWADVYKKLIYWELSLEKLEDAGMHEVLTLQKAEANMQFFKFIEKKYLQWVKEPESGPVMSHQLFRKKVFPTLQANRPTFFFLIDNIRYDQWRSVTDVITSYFRLEVWTDFVMGRRVSGCVTIVGRGHCEKQKRKSQKIL